MHVGVPIWWWLIFSKPSNPRFRGKVVQKCPIWGHHTQIHRFYGIKRWNTMRKKKLICRPYTPSWSQRSSDSGNIHCLQIKWIFNFTIVTLFLPKKPLDVHPYCSTTRGHRSSHFLQKIMSFLDFSCTPLILYTYSLPERDGHCEHGGIAVYKNAISFLSFFQRLMP